MKQGYQCENCGGFHTNRDWIFKCNYCGKEICEWCFDYWGTCKECSAGKTEQEVKEHHISIWGNPDE